MGFYCEGKKQICETPTNCSGCEYFDFSGGSNATMTNADHIRAMSDEEQKDFMLAVHLGYSPWCDHHCENKGDDGCDRCIEKWLQQPAEEAAHHA